jgi:hypothetical protein
MANVGTSWRLWLVAALDTAFPDAEVKSGRRQGVSRDKDRINVFTDPAVQGHLPDRIVVSSPRMVIRYWKRRSEVPAPDSPPDATELEQARQDLETFFETHQRPPVTDLWFAQLESVHIDDDPEEWGVEARIVGYGRNLAVTA